MEHFFDLKATKIFKDADEFDCQAMMYCFKTRFKRYEKNEVIVAQGEQFDDVVLIVKGSAKVENMDTMGNINILMQLKRGEVYGLESAYAMDTTYKDSLIATERTLVLFMNKIRLVKPCQNRCKRHDNVVRNLMQTVAENNQHLMEKLSHLSKKTIRDKLMSYFSLMKQKAGSEYFEIPFNKTELANYLSVDRSAMSAELSKMREEGLIDFDKNEYRILHKNKKEV